MNVVVYDPDQQDMRDFSVQYEFMISISNVEMTCWRLRKQYVDV